MLFTEKGAEAQDVASRALGAMQAHGVPPTPVNFTVWYCYCSGRHPDLTRTIDLLLANDEPFTAARNEELFEGFFGGEGQPETIRGVTQQVEGVAKRILTDLQDTGGDVAAYGEKLAAFGDDVRAGVDLAPLIKSMQRETAAAQARTRALEAQLGEATAEIQDLRARIEDVRMESLTDGLTGLFNRKYFDAQLRRDTRAATETEEPLSVVFCDIDHFKRFNDSYGHAVGDEVIKLVARTLKQNVKGRDTPARYGGEEFAVILPQTGLTGAVTLADQIRRKLAGKELMTKDHARSFGTVTMSLGVAEYRFGEPLDDLLQRADEALYAAKNSGRNCVMPEAARVHSAASA
jgi:diguanylate cyclase